MDHQSEATMKVLLKQYRATHRNVKASLEKMRDINPDDRTPQDIADIYSLEAMMLDLGFCIRYMEQKKYPDPMHSISRWATTKREVLMEPEVMNRVFGERFIMPCEESEKIDDGKSELIEKYLGLLSVRERECFLLIYERGIAYREAAVLLGVQHGRVNNIMHRVRKKFQTIRDDYKNK